MSLIDTIASPPSSSPPTSSTPNPFGVAGVETPLIVAAATEVPTAPAESVQPIPTETDADDFDILGDIEPSGENVAGAGEPITQPQPQPDVTKEAGEKRRGRPPGSKNKVSLIEPGNPINYAATAELLFNGSTGVLSAYVGEEWCPSSKQEKQMMVDALAAYLKSKEIKDIPPGWALLGVSVLYTLARAGHPNTSSKVKTLWGKVSSAVKSWALWSKIKNFFRSWFTPANPFKSSP